MQNWQQYKLIIQTSKNSKAILRYVDKNISAVNRVGIILRIDKITAAEMDEATIEVFRKRGIMRFPALIGPENAKYIGITDIVELFESRINNAKAVSRAATDRGGLDLDQPDDTLLSDFYQREMFNADGTNKTNDEEETMNEPGSNIERRMADYERNKPRHHTASNEMDINRSRAPRQPTNYIEPMQRNVARETARDYPADNIQQDDDVTPVRLPKLGRTSDPAGDEMDQRIADAWMNNL